MAARRSAASMSPASSAFWSCLSSGCACSTRAESKSGRAAMATMPSRWRAPDVSSKVAIFARRRRARPLRRGATGFGSVRPRLCGGDADPAPSEKEDRWPVAYTAMVLAVQLGDLLRGREPLDRRCWWPSSNRCRRWPSPATTTSTTGTCGPAGVQPPLRDRALPADRDAPVPHHSAPQPRPSPPLSGRRRRYAQLATSDGSPMPLGQCLWRNTVGHLEWTVAIGRRHPRIYRRLQGMLAPSLLPLLALDCWIGAGP